MSSEPRVRWNLTSLNEITGIWHGYGTWIESSLRIDRVEDGRFRAIVAIDGETIVVHELGTLSEAQEWCEAEIAEFEEGVVGDE